MNSRLLIKLLMHLFIALTFFELSAQCVLPPSNTFDEFYSGLTERKDWKKKMERNTARLENYKYKSEMDSLFQYAVAYFKHRLPEDRICEQVDVSDSAWLSFHNSNIKMNFAYYLSNQSTGRYDEKITVHFSYYIKEKQLSFYHAPNNLWVPNCKLYPDSCNFKITSIKQCEKIAQKIGFIKKDQKARGYSGKKIPFHYGLTKSIDDDCGTQTLYINMYSGDTILSSRNLAYGCQTWKNKINGSSLIVDGTVVEEEAFSIDRSIYTKAKIEIHHLFKGESKSNFIYAIVQGGQLGSTTSSLSHGQIRLGKKKERNIYFLNRDSKYEDRILPIEELLGHEIYLTNYDPYPAISRYESRDSNRKSYEEQFQLIEKIIGKKREARLHPGNWEVKQFSRRIKTFPDRQKGLDLLLVEEYRESFKDSLYVYFAMSSTNDILYLKEWEFNLEYDTSALGPRILENNKIDIPENYWAFKKFDQYYNLEVSEINENTLKFKWSARDTTKLFFEFFPAQNEKPKMQFISALKLSILDATKPLNLQLNVASQAIGYNHTSQEEYLIKNHRKSNIISHPFLYYKAPTIDNFYPQTASIGDTITITGKYLENSNPILFGISLSNKEKFLELEKKDIMSVTDTEIVFVIPSFLSDKYRVKPINLGNETFKPSTNIIYLTKKTAYKGASSKEELIIK